MLLEGSLRSFLQECINALIEIVRGHVVVNDAKTGDVNGLLVRTSINVIGHLCQLTHLLRQLDRFPIRSAL